MTTPDGSFSSKLWVQRVLEGVAEQEVVSCSGSPGSSHYIGSPGNHYSPGSSHQSPAHAHPNRFASPTAAYAGSPGSSNYTPPFIASPTRPGTWGSPLLPPS